MRNFILMILLGLMQLKSIADPVSVPIKRLKTDLGDECNISMELPISAFTRLRNGDDPALGEGSFRVVPLPEAWKSAQGQLVFDLSCKRADDQLVRDGLATWNEKNGLWEKNLDKWIYPPPRTPQERKVLDESTQIFNLNAINAKGYVGVYEQIKGRRASRVRELSFCLIHFSKAICGHGEAGVLSDGEEGNLTQQILQIIRSIEFQENTSERVPSGCNTCTRR